MSRLEHQMSDSNLHIMSSITDNLTDRVLNNRIRLARPQNFVQHPRIRESRFGGSSPFQSKVLRGIRIEYGWSSRMEYDRNCRDDDSKRIRYPWCHDIRFRALAKQLNTQETNELIRMSTTDQRNDLKLLSIKPDYVASNRLAIS